MITGLIAIITSVAVTYIIYIVLATALVPIAKRQGAGADRAIVAEWLKKCIKLT